MRPGICALLAALVILPDCRLLQRTDLSGYDPATRTIFIHNFTNQTFQADVNVELTEWVKLELNRRDNFKTRTDKDEAHIWIYCEVAVYSRDGRMYDNFQNPTRYEMTVAGRLKIRTNPAMSGPMMDKAGEVSATVQYSEKEGYPESEYAARQRLLRTLAARIADSIESEYLATIPAAPVK